MMRKPQQEIRAQCKYYLCSILTILKLLKKQQQKLCLSQKRIGVRAVLLLIRQQRVNSGFRHIRVLSLKSKENGLTSWGSCCTNFLTLAETREARQTGQLMH